jgi:excinuclease ABC subunit A
VRQNNLKGFDLDVPLGRYVAVTGLSGAGKSSLVFDTLHAEGQRRYVETFSAYTRQFLDLLDKPQVDSIENIRPSIAIAQTNTIKNSRSTVGTMTELTDFFKVWFSQAAACFDPATGERVEDDSPQSIWTKVAAAAPDQAVIVAFEVVRPASLSWPEILANLKQQAYVRVLVPAAAKTETGATGSIPVSTVPDAPDTDASRAAAGPRGTAGAGGGGFAAAGNWTVRRVDDLLAEAEVLAPTDRILVAQDRLTTAEAERNRFVEAVETAMHFGRGAVRILAAETLAELGHYSRGLHSPSTGRTFRAPTPALFSFNSPLGACPKCRGFGRVIELDPRLALPDPNLSIDEGAIKCWEGEVYGASKADLRKFTRRRGIPTNVPFARLTPEQQAFVMDGEPGYGEENGKTWPEYWYGVKGFFRWLEKNTYKMHVRVFLSRYRTYRRCPDCGGTRLQPESLCWQWRGRTLPALYQLPVDDLIAALRDARPAAGERQSELAYDAILTRLYYLSQVGLGYLTLDRSSRTLSGGEVERVNLTSCLGTSLVDTLFVLDEPSVGLHPRDIGRLLGILRALVDAGNTVVVVEHDEAMIRAADHVIEIGPEPGERGGHLVFQGSVAELLRSEASLTGAYFSGRRSIAAPARRRPVRPGEPAIEFEDATIHNLRGVSLRLPLGRFVCLSGVSGSGKSTLLNAVIHQGLLADRGLPAEEPAAVAAIRGGGAVSEVVLVDQGPLSRTPRSNPALYTEAWDPIRELLAATPAAQAAGLNASSFSFNGGDGRCDHCQGLGYERVEMQFLSDVFVPCPVCEGRRFKPEVLAITWNDCSVDALLKMSVTDALVRFADQARIHHRLSVLEAVGLGYLALGQPLNTLSGGESQRLKLVRYLGALPGQTGALLLLDEPTTGLHRHDVKRLLEVLQALVDRGHSLVVIEHNLDVLKSADWILEIGPEAGAAGGRIVAAGTPEELAAADTATSPFLREALREADEGDRRPRAEPAGMERTAIGSAAARTNEKVMRGSAGGAPALITPTERTPSPALTAASCPAPALPPPRVPGALEVVGASENNLKSITVSIPHQRLTVVTGVSGSGKSTLAFDIVFAEGQRRFMESMSPYARQFVEQMPRPALDRISGLPPAVAIEQRVTRGSRKSTVATITEVAQYLRLLYARLGVQHHPETDRPVTPLSPGALRKLLERVLATPAARRAKHLYLCAPLVRGRKGHHQPIADWITQQGYALMRADGRLIRADAFKKLDRYKEHDIEVVVADLAAVPSARGKPTKGGAAGQNAKGPRAAFAVSAPSVAIKSLTQGRASTAPALAEALRLGKGACFLITERGAILSWFSSTRTDVETGESFPELDPKHFSFNSPRGWCPLCRGHGRVFPWMLQPETEEGDDGVDRMRRLGLEVPEDLAEAGVPCPECHGARLNRTARAVKLHFRGRRPPLSLPDLLRLTAAPLLASLRELALDERARLVTRDLVPQIEERLKFLSHVGLGYLALERPTGTLSGGEAQRIRLAAQLGTNLAGVLYVLDEPSIGLHARDNRRLIGTLQSLRDKGNTLLVVEHDDELMEQADWIIDLGPGAGVHGGEVLASGTPAQIKASERSLTGRFLATGIAHPLRGAYRELPPKTGALPWLELKGARFRNLKGFDLRLPPGRLILVAGPSGAGKSTLFRDLLGPAAACAIDQRSARLTGTEFVRATGFAGDEPASAPTPPPFTELLHAEGFRSVIEVDQSPIGKTPRSTPATYLGIFDLIRQFFASLPESKLRGYTASRFSFNTAGGRCPTCEGAGRIKLEMAFLPDAYLPCDDCRGTRFGPELADIAWKGRNIGQVLQLTFEEASDFFDFHSSLAAICRLMGECGLGYLTLGQSSPTLSGGEAQRLKLVTELSKGLATYRERSRGTPPRNLYLLEEPTIGLHLSDCEKLIRVLHSLVDQGHTVVVIEHHLDLLAEADYIIELGPEGGPNGGQLLYQGPLAGLLKVKGSPTAPFLRQRKYGLVGGRRQPAAALAS